MVHCLPNFLVFSLYNVFNFQAPLLHVVEEYTMQRQLREDEKRRSRVCFSMQLPAIRFLCLIHGNLSTLYKYSFN